MAFPNRWPGTRAKWREPEDWAEPGSRERIDFLDSGTLMPGDVVELRDGRRMQVVTRGRPDADGSVRLGLIDP